MKSSSLDGHDFLVFGVVFFYCEVTNNECNLKYSQAYSAPRKMGALQQKYLTKFLNRRAILLTNKSSNALNLREGDFYIIGLGKYIFTVFT